jgi:hypothetical protein
MSKHDVIYVEYHSQRKDEIPFFMGEGKFEFVNAIYPSGKKDLGVYAFRGDVTYSYEHFRSMFGLDNRTPAVDERILEMRERMRLKDLGKLPKRNPAKRKINKFSTEAILARLNDRENRTSIPVSSTNKKAAAMTVDEGRAYLAQRGREGAFGYSYEEIARMQKSGPLKRIK